LLDNHRKDYRFTELDADLLLNPIRIQTNWHVITGTVSSGKSTLIEKLSDSGFQTVPEAARKYNEQGMAKGRRIDEIRVNPATLQRDINDSWLRYEQRLRVNDVLFLDRAFPDALAFYRVNGLDPNEILVDCFHYRYASVFLLDRFPVKQDGVRFHDAVTADLIEEWLIRDYTALGYSIVRVPVLSLQERLEFVLEKLSERGLM
jgi:predicted ATPase